MESKDSEFKEEKMNSTSFSHKMSNFIFFVYIIISMPFLFFLSFIPRCIAAFCMWRIDKEAEFVSSNDIFLFYGNSNDRTMTLGSFLCSGSIDIDLFRSILLEKFVKPIPRLQRYIEENFQYHFWIKEKNFSINDHVFWHPELAVSTKDEWKKVERKLYYKVIPSQFSPWFVHFVPVNSDYEETEEKNSFYMVVVFHHSLGDVYSCMRLYFRAVADDIIPEPYHSVWPVPTMWEEFAQLINFFCFYHYMIYENYTRENLSFNQSMIYGRLIYLDSKDLETQTIKDIKKIINVPFKVVLLTCVMGALEKFFRKKNYPTSKPIPFFIPQVLWKPNENLIMTNNFIPLRLRLPFSQKHCTERLKEINDILNSTYTRRCYIFNYIVLKYMGNYLPSSILSLFYKGFCNSAMLSIAGTNHFPEYILGKRKMICDKPMKRIVPLVNNIGIAFQAMTVGETIKINVIAKSSIATEEDLKNIIRDIENEFEELKKTFL